MEQRAPAYTSLKDEKQTLEAVIQSLNLPERQLPEDFAPHVVNTCRSRIFMQPSEDRHGEGRGQLGIQQRCRVPLLVRNDRPARRCSRTGVFATDGSNPDTTTYAS